MRLIGIMVMACILLSSAAYADPVVSMQDTISMAEGGNIAQTASNDAQVAGDEAILYQSNSQGAVGTGDVNQAAENTGLADGEDVNVNQGSTQSAEGDSVYQSASNSGEALGDFTTLGQSITQGATAESQAQQVGDNYAVVIGGNAWIGQLVQSGSMGENTYLEASNFAVILDNAGIGNNAMGQSIILGATATADVVQVGDNIALLLGGNGNLAQLAQAGATGDYIGQSLRNRASVTGADTFVVGQTNIAGAETDMSAGTIAELLQLNLVEWDTNADGMLNQHIEAASLADLVSQQQQNIVTIV